MFDTITIHFHFDSVDAKSITKKLSSIVAQGERTMATVEEVQAAIEAEKAEVAAKLEALAAEIVALQEQVAAGTGVTAEQLDGILVGVQGIFTPAVVDPVL